ncbi:MAG: malonic semialdehyde reductase [Candidatus Thiodubiliella endoseptemdiera]|uniref:Putative NADH dehydrogenase/NAD(P)H nitroreductase H0A76_09760 n=1 Tax=Candidatus Thiodubiliella endoseptemdiera TaxID=2738886 RepID=A0A853F2E8_9GAMM|nr:malonic semialdehyde reductase [Candidatus Thiodubiliella endoseptemdiera]
MLDKNTMDILFTEARSHNAWLNKDISNEQIHQLYHLMKFGPTAANTCPARITFVRSDEVKAKLKAHLDEGNVDKAMTAPAVAIISYDTEFYEKLDKLFPHTDAKGWYEGKPDKIKEVGSMNATLQGAYFMLAARSIGLDCGPMGGFNASTLDTAFFPDGKTKSIFICGIGYGDASKIFPRSPRLDFDEACQII